MTKPYQQFRNKAEAQQAIEDMERRAGRCDNLASWQRVSFKREHEENAARHYRAEATRIRALYETLPE